MVLCNIANQYERRETTIKTINVEDNIVSVCTKIHKTNAFSQYKKALDLNLSGLGDLGRITLAYFHAFPPTLEQIRELRRASSSNESLFLYLSDILEDSK